MLEVRRLAVSYGKKIRALHEVTLQVTAGEIVCLLGANGAGKSTLLKTLSGLLAPEEGQVIFEGQRVEKLPPHAVAEVGLIHVPEGRRIFPRLTVEENLYLGAWTQARGKAMAQDRDRLFHLFPKLKDRRRQWGGTLSGGEQQMLAIARGLMARPKLLMLDEPSMGLSPVLVSQIFDLIVRIHREGVAILLVEQNALQALRVAQRGYVLEGGRVVLEGASALLRENPQIQASYLGVS